jgi:hypothetical protein
MIDGYSLTMYFAGRLAAALFAVLALGGVVGGGIVALVWWLA